MLVNLFRLISSWSSLNDFCDTCEASSVVAVLNTVSLKDVLVGKVSVVEEQIGECNAITCSR